MFHVKPFNLSPKIEPSILLKNQLTIILIGFTLNLSTLASILPEEHRKQLIHIKSEIYELIIMATFYIG